ncbi:uncharacterized protein E5676_scaffold1317G00610 [Cucumis melo var. makuwa]|uniref:Ulp1-like peptidase n=1 Tax=Cucumis melo var. makuwa TaxID=1194695 RepID=A0A5A7U0E6_CUCMM|nr:uncharacterized protein E6C27_scaffold466G00290 [Cucumis melo var. makuwa]TYK05086.1 uncharacterized protein E5676_scaffold1317G00610 [Cucumis melo var. makuwa]
MSKNGGSKRGREVVNDEDDLKKSKKQKSKTKMKKAIRNLQDRVAVVEGQLTSIKSDIDELKGMMSTILQHIGLQRKIKNETVKCIDGDEGDRKGFEGLVDHTVESEKVDNAKTEDVDTGDRLRAWITDKRTDDEVCEIFHGKKSKIFFRDLFMYRRWLAEEHLDALFLFIRLKIKAARIPSAQNFTTTDTIFMSILVAKSSLYKECIKENRSFD